MQYIILALSLLLLSSLTHAQCGKKVTWYVSKVESIDANGGVVRTIEDEMVVVAGKEEILFQQPSDERHNMRASIKEVTCTWEQPYKKGKTVYKVEFVREDGETSSGTISIEATDGNIIANVYIEKANERGRLTISKYKEETL